MATSYQAERLNQALIKRGVENESLSIQNSASSGFFHTTSTLIEGTFDVIQALLSIFLVIFAIYLVLKAILNFKAGGASQALANLNQDVNQVFGFFKKIFTTSSIKIRNTFSFLRARKLATGSILITIIIIVFIFRFNLIQVIRIQPGQKGVDIKSGKILSPGIHVTTPIKAKYIIAHVARYQFDIPEVTADSKELQDVVIHINLSFHLEENELVAFYQREGIITIAEVADSIVTPRSVEKMKNIVKNYSFKEIVDRQIEIKEQAMKEIQASLAPIGIRLDDVNIVNIMISRKLVETLGERDIMDEKMEIADKELQIAEKEKNKKVIEAEGIAESNRLIGEQNLTNEMLELKRIENEKEAIEKWDGKVPQSVGGNFSIGME